MVRVRFQNPLPAPPYPPKLLNIPTNPERYASLDYTGELANETPFPMVVDAEMGMPLDLSRYECLWQEGGDPLQLNPDPENLPPIDPKDEFMLEGFTMQAGPTRPGGHTSSQPLQVSWLRRTEYVTAKDSSPRMTMLSKRGAEEANVDISREAQIRDVEATFPPSYHGIDITEIRHPARPARRAVEVFEVLPDPETFATATDIFRFPERPGERPLVQEDPRLDCAVIRPVVLDDGETFIAYYLPRDDASAAELKQRRDFALEMNLSADDKPVAFDLVRNYESKVLPGEGTELVLFFDNGDLPAHVDAVGTTREPESRQKGVYYKLVDTRRALKRKRVDPNEPTDYSTKTDVINLSYRAMDEGELKEREAELEELINPFYEPQEELDQDDAEKVESVRDPAIDVFGADDMDF